MSNSLFDKNLNVVNVGAAAFKDDLSKQGVAASQVNWMPPRVLSPELQAAIDTLNRPEIASKIDAANKEAVERIVKSHPMLIGYAPALEVVPGMTKETILHAGPPVAWEDMAGAMQGAIMGALVFEELAGNLEEAAELAASGKITFSPCHEHGCVGSMSGITSASMFMHIIKNKTYGNVSYTNLSEQLAKILRMGANDQSVIDRLVWMRDVLGPMLRDAVKLSGEIDLRMMLAQAIHMGDEDHNRNIAGTLLLQQKLTPYLVQTDFTTEQKKEVFEFIASSDYFSGPTWMAFCKNSLDAGHGIKNSSIVTTMCRNGYEFAIRLSHFEGFNWFIGPAQVVKGPMMAGFKPEDSGRDIGDSSITETFGIGAFAMAAAPAIVPLVGGTVEEALNVSRDMMEITTTTNPNITIPILDFRGLATGIDARKVIETGMLPQINTAIAHKDAGVGMIGTGLVKPPFECFEKAIIAFADAVAKG